jgi:hypothetical protein
VSETTIGQIIGGIVTLAGLWITYLKVKSELKNKVGEVEAKTDKHAKVAVEAALQAKEATEVMANDVSRKLNGELHKAISDAVATAVAPVVERIERLERYKHRFEHDLRNILGVNQLKTDLVYDMLVKAFPQHAPGAGHADKEARET